MMETYHITTLGCPKNLVDSEIMATMLDDAGWQLVPNPLEATLLVVNTCAFVDAAQEESLEALLSAIALKQAGACRLVVASGCLVQRYGDELSQKLPAVDLLVGVRDFHKLVPRIAVLCSSGLKRRLYRSSQTVTPLYERRRRPLEASHVRYLKIAEGCDCSCGFCTIPSIRGPQRSRPLSRVVEEARGLLARGAKELIVIAQDTTSYGIDTEGRMLLPALLEQLAGLIQNPQETWIRVLYLQPTRVSKTLLEAMNLPGILPYCDLAIQHSSPKVLKAMRRPIPPNGWEPLIEHIRASLPGAALRATILLGHPGETERAFNHLLRFLENAKLDRVGVFAFSPQQGTPSAKLKAPPPETVDQRMAEIESLLATQAHHQFQPMLGKSYRFMIDGQSSKAGELACRPWFDAPDIDWSYSIPVDSLDPGTVIQGRVVGGRAGDVAIESVEECG